MRRFGLFLLLPVGLLSWMACVGDDSTAASPAEGGLGQRCYANGSCIPGLVCVASKCEAASGATPPPSASTPPPAGPLDAGQDAADAAPAVCRPPAAFVDDDEIWCGREQRCLQGEQCCRNVSVLECAVADTCAPEDIRWTCETNADCINAGADVCCLLGARSNASACEITLEGATTECLLPTDCDNANGLASCVDGTECADGYECTPTELRAVAGFTVQLRSCKPIPDGGS